MDLPLAAVLAAAESVRLWPALTDPGSATTARGRRAAATAPGALAIPAPQVLVVHEHSVFCTSFCAAGTWHCRTVESVDTGNGFVAPSLSRASKSAEPRLLLTDAMSPTIPETIGAEKLVPKFALIWFV